VNTGGGLRAGRPAARPHVDAFDGSSIAISSWETERVWSSRADDDWMEPEAFATVPT
jgi:hypothetical protein